MQVDWRRELLLTEVRAAAAARHRAEVEGHLAAARADLAAARADLAGVVTELEAVRATVSWRVTRPLRAVRRVGRAVQERVAPTGDDAHTAPQPADPAEQQVDALERRLTLVADAVASRGDGGQLPVPASDATVDVAHRLADAVDASSLPEGALAWLVAAAALGRYPVDDEVDVLAGAFRLDGGGGLVTAGIALFREAVAGGTVVDRGLDILPSEVLVDVTHTATYDALTGIQRVVREAAAHWIPRHHPHLVCWDAEVGGYRRLSILEHDRFVNWRRTVTGELHRREVEFLLGDPVVPLGGRLVVPELAAEAPRAAGVRCLARSGVLERVSLLVHDVIPITATELVSPGMSGDFAQYVSVLKHAHRVSTTCDATAADVTALGALFASQGFTAPTVASHFLPGAAESVDDTVVATFRQRLRLDDAPVFLVVGSREPRKNHGAVLEAAELCWRAGYEFTLLFVGGPGWRSDLVDRQISQLTALGRAVVVHGRATEAELAAAYRSALATLFPSLAEGFGIPCTESLSVGTPVVTSAYGSMAEIAKAGGVLLVDPRSPARLAEAMRSLLDDPTLVTRLRAEALRRPPRTWEDYAEEAWQFLAGDG
jgi:glycosyltransferase involved in cell wall biosynthesis